MSSCSAEIGPTKKATSLGGSSVTAKICSHGHVRVKAPTRTC